MFKEKTFTSTAASRLDNKTVEDDVVFGSRNASVPSAPKDRSLERKITVSIDSDLYQKFRQYLADPDTPDDKMSTVIRNAIAERVYKWENGKKNDGTNDGKAI